MYCTVAKYRLVHSFVLKSTHYSDVFSLGAASKRLAKREERACNYYGIAIDDTRLKTLKKITSQIIFSIFLFTNFSQNNTLIKFG